MEQQAFDTGQMMAALIVLGIELVLLVVIVASLWKLFTKAGVPGWMAIVPILNMVKVLQIAGYSGGALVGMFVGFFIPFLNIVVAVLWGIKLAARFGKSTGYGIGVALLGIVFIPMLAFGDAEYQGESAAG